MLSFRGYPRWVAASSVPMVGCGRPSTPPPVLFALRKVVWDRKRKKVRELEKEGPEY
jgi:hypothetical protein